MIFFTRNESSLVRVTDRWSNLRTSTWLCSSARGVIAIAKTRLVLESNYVVRGVVSPLAYITFLRNHFVGVQLTDFAPRSFVVQMALLRRDSQK